MQAILYTRVSTKEQVEGYSLRQQLEALRDHCKREGYEILAEEEDPGVSGAALDRPGLDKVRDLVQEGGVDVVLAQDRDRISREPAYLYLLKEEFAIHGTALRSLNNRGDDSPEGELTDGILDQLAKFERAKTTERTRRGKLRKAQEGKLVGGSAVHFGFRRNEDGTAYEVDEAKMAFVRKMFRMVGTEGATLAAVKRSFESSGLATPRNADRWDTTTIRRMIDNDVYLARPAAEVAKLVSPEVAARLDHEKLYGIYWFARTRSKRNYGPGPVLNITHRERDKWIPIPTPDPGIPTEWVLAARTKVKDNVRPPDAGHRFWELKSLLFCPCGRRTTTFAARRKYKSKTYLTYHYICSHKRRHGAGSCDHARYHNAEDIEGRVRDFVRDLIRRPEVMMERVREDIEREKARLERAGQERLAWSKELENVERRRDSLIEMRADGDITKEKFREKSAALDTRKAAAERELKALDASSEREKFLDSLPSLIEEYIADLPDLVHGVERPVRDYAIKDEYSGSPYQITPDVFRERTPEEKEELIRAEEWERAARYRAIYELLGIKAVIDKDGTLEVSGAFGVGSVKVGDKRAPGKVPPPDSPSWDEEDRCHDPRAPRRTPSRPSCRLSRSVDPTSGSF